MRSLVSVETSRNVVLNVLSNNRSLQVPVDIKKMIVLVNITRRTHNFTISKNYDIPEELQFTSDGKQFLFLDTGMEDPTGYLSSPQRPI